MFRNDSAVAGCLLALALIVGMCAPAIADSATVFEDGVVMVDQRGTVSVVTASGEYEPINGAALLRAGQIAAGGEVTVKITTDKGHKHRGHVTILK